MGAWGDLLITKVYVLETLFFGTAVVGHRHEWIRALPA